MTNSNSISLQRTIKAFVSQSFLFYYYYYYFHFHSLYLQPSPFFFGCNLLFWFFRFGFEWYHNLNILPLGVLKIGKSYWSKFLCTNFSTFSKLSLFGKIQFEVKMGILALVAIGIWRGKLKGWNEWEPTFDTPFSSFFCVQMVPQFEPLFFWLFWKLGNSSLIEALRLNSFYFFQTLLIWKNIIWSQDRHTSFCS